MLHSPEIIWKGTIPVSSRFDDIYFSKDGGALETKHVFLTGNQLPEKWNGKERFTIFEFGFGFGLNFIETWKLFEESSDGVLFYFAVEKYPVKKSDLAIISENHSEHKDKYNKLIEYFPHLIPGFHRLQLTKKISLTLLLGDVEDIIKEFQGKIDAWFLDGFSPAKNPKMWSASVFHFMKIHSHFDTTFATYTVASDVRKNLAENGFSVQKIPGFGKKKEMLVGKFLGEDKKQNNYPWFKYNKPLSYKKTVTIIGGGLAGTSLAESLGRRGVKVTIFEKGKIASSASGNPVGIFYPFISADFSWYARFSLEAYGYFLRHLKNNEIYFEKCGVNKLITSQHDLDKAEKAKKVFGLDEEILSITEKSLFFSEGSFVSPPEVCEGNLRNISDLKINHIEIGFIKYEDSKWRLYDIEESFLQATDILVLANSFSTVEFSESEFMPMKKIRGQINFVKATEKSNKLKNIICYDGYCLPAYKNMHVIGATYRDESFNSEIADRVLNQNDSIELFNKANQHLKSFLHDELFYEEDITGGRVSYRAQTQDRIAVIGAIPDEGWFYENYKSYPYLKDKSKLPEAELVPGLYITSGHGSRGLLNTHLGAELLAAEIFGEPLPVEKSIADELNPARFIIRNLKRQKSAR